MAEKGIKTVWIDSDSVGVLGTKVYRDDILIATVPFGTLFYNDPTAVIGVQYKYEVQAYTSASESTDETLGVNMDYYTLGGSTGLTPIMSGFAVSEAEPNLIYFNTPLGSVTGLTPQGFVIADSAGLVGHTVRSVNTTENYLELDTPFDYWDNPLISLVGGDGTVYDFTLQSVDNQTAEKGSLSARYISADGTGGGLTEGDPMSFASAAAETNRAGRIYWVKKGNYTGLNGIEWNSGGTHTDPVKIVGYDTVIGDHPVLDWSTSNPDFDANVMPLIDGGDLYSTPFNFRADYFIIKNIQIQNYTQDNFYFSNGAGFIDIDNCYSHNSTNGFMFISSSTENNRITNSIIYGADTHGIQMGTTDGIAYTAWANKGRCLIDNVKVYSASTIDNGLDYFIKINNCDNTIKNCHVEKLTPTSHVGSGIDLKADEVITERNLIENCTGTTVKAVINLRHELCSNNVVKNVTANKVAADQSGCIAITAGSSYNTLENITAIGVDEFVRWYDITETVNDVGMGSYNKFINCVADNIESVIYSGRFTGSDNPTGPATNNEFLNCTWTNCTYLFGAFMFTFDNTNKFTNNIFDTVANLVNGSATGTQAFVFDYNLFYSPTNTDWSYTGDGTNKITLIDPDLNASYQPQATFTDIDVPRIDGVYYDKDWNERQDPTTVGAVLSAEEAPNAIPVYSVSTSDLGMIEDNESEALNNANKLIGGLNSTVDGINVDGVYFIQTPGTSLTATDIRLASTNSGELKSNQSLTALFTSLGIENIEVDGATFSDVFSGGGDYRLFYDNSSIGASHDIGTLRFNSCTFNGNISAYRKRPEGDIDPATFGMDTLTLTNNYINNNRSLMFYIRDIPIAVCNIKNNQIHNFDNTLFEIAIGNGNAYTDVLYYYRPLFTVTNNTAINDIDWECFNSNGAYTSFAVLECDEVIYQNNHVEGIWCRAIPAAVYDAYLSCNIVSYKYNTNKNNILFVDDDYVNTLMKGKGGAPDYQISIRDYQYNDFITEESWIDALVLSHSVNKDYSFVNYADIGGNGPTVDTKIKNNTFNIYNFNCRTNNTNPVNYEVSGNTFNLTLSNNMYTETILMTDDNIPESIVFNDNIFNVLNTGLTNPSPISIVRVIDNRVANTDKIGSITFNNNTGITAGFSAFGEHDTDLFEMNNNTLTLSNTTGSTIPYFFYTSFNKVSNSSNNDITYQNEYYYMGNQEYAAECTINENITFNGIHGSNAFGTTMLLKTGLPSSPTKTIRRTYDVDDSTEVFYFEFTLSYDADHWNVTFIDNGDVEQTYQLNNQDGVTDGNGTYLKVYNTVGSNASEIRFRNLDGVENTGFEQILGASDMKLNLTTQNI